MRGSKNKIGAGKLAYAACGMAALAAISMEAVPAEQAAAKPVAKRIERLACSLGTDDSHARIAVEVLNGRVHRFAYYSKWRPRTCSMEIVRGDPYSKWLDQGATTAILLLEEMGSFLIDHGQGRYQFTFSDVDRTRYCGMAGKINGYITVRRASPRCELEGLMVPGPIEE